ncbi:3-deoxy-D-manno-octulosonic acid transferase [Pseudohalocynthiibacter aestuariivivens]|uniref:3-deoxy-D-manno-octulosonic acid transferase n=1 Tax=Pseudohalocynthiibacter aestuariivivens TaxID=1591409 RepID=UPI0036720A2C
MVDQAGFSCAVRSQDTLPKASDDIYLADTMGEMPLWYSSAATTFVAGSLVPVGGHTPFEPAVYGSAIIHGSQYSNFKAIYEQLVCNNGSIQADTADEIATAWIKLLDENSRNTQIAASKKSLFKNGAKGKMLDEITFKVASLL